MENKNYNKILFALGINKIESENSKKTSNSHSKLNSNSSSNYKFYDEENFKKLYFQLKEKINQKLYKKTIIEIDYNIKKIKNINQIKKIEILKIICLIKIIKTKTQKYFYDNKNNNNNSFQKNSIKKYSYFIKKQILNITNNFFETNKKICLEMIKNNIDFIQEIFYIYFYYLNTMLKYYLIQNDFKNISLHFIYSFKLFKFSCEFITNSKTLNKISNIFLLYSKFLLINKEYENCIFFLEKTINICFKELIFKINNIFSVKKNNNNIKTIKNIVISLYFLGTCYENMGKIKNSAECYKQCFWFAKKFFYKNNKYNFFYIFFKFLVEKSICFNEAILYIKKCVDKKNNIKNSNDNNINKNFNKIFDEKCEKKYKNLIKFIKNLNIKEINTINKYKYPHLYIKKFPFNHKEFNLNNLRLLEAYSSKEFKNIIIDMKKINLFDIDNNLFNKIQNNYSKRFYDSFIHDKNESKNYKNNNFNESNNNNNNNNNNDNNKTFYHIKLLNKSKSSKEQNLIFKKIFLKKNSDKNYNNINFINYSKNSSIIKTNNNNLSFSMNNNNFSNSNTNFNSNNKISSKFLSKIENIKMNFSPINIKEKKYKKKLKYISKLTDREFDFQKNLLSLKKHSIDNKIKIFNKFEVKKNALNFFNKINILNNINFNNKNFFNSISNEEYHKMKINNNIENTFYKSLNNKSFIKYKKNLIKNKQFKSCYQQESDDDENDINSFNKKTMNLLDKNLKYIENNIKNKKKQLKNKKISSNE